MARADCSRVLVASALLLVAWNLRAAIVALSPLLPEIRRSLDLSSPLAGLLTTLPLLCFGVFAFLAPAAGRRLGAERMLVAVLGAITGGVALRLLPGDLALYAGTTLAGAGIAVGNVTLPAAVRRDFPDRIALMTGLAATGVVGGAAVAAGASVPLQDALGIGWRPSLALWAIPAAVALAVLVPAARSAPPRPPRKPVRGGKARPGRLWLDPVAIVVTGFMGLQSLDFYATVAWLPTIFQAKGLSAGQAGWLVSYATLVSIPTTFGGPLAARRVGRAAVVVLAVLACAVALGGLALDPAPLALAWMTLLGLGQGAAFSLALSFIAERAADAESTAQLSMLAQGGGYLLASIGPVGLGLVHDLSGGWRLPPLVLLALLAPELAAGLAACRPRQTGSAWRARLAGVQGAAP